MECIKYNCKKCEKEMKFVIPEYCSKQCRGEKAIRVVHNCVTCGKTFNREWVEAYTRNWPNKYCDKVCLLEKKHQRGKAFSSEVLLQIKEWHKIYLPDFIAEKLNIPLPIIIRIITQKRWKIVQDKDVT